MLFAYMLVPGFAQNQARAAAAAPVEDSGGMVVTANAHASRVGAEILARGGNAVDAAVATSFALAVVEPYHSGIGGGAFLLIRTAAGETIALDGREEAPRAATAGMYLEEGVPEDASRLGGLAAGVPGLVDALCEALAKYGTFSLADVMAPAIALAQDGVPIGPRHAGLLNYWRTQGLAERFPETASIQFPPLGEPIRPGWVLRQPELAQTLREISRKGPDAFYKGPTAQAMVDEVQRTGGIWSLEDLAGYQPKTRQAIAGSYRGLQVFSFPPPSSGGVALVEILNILEELPVSERGPGSSASIHLIAEAMKLAFADRAAHLGDADFVSVPVEGLISKSYAETLRRRINPPWYRRAPWFWFARERAITVKAAGQPSEDAGTSHFSIADAQGNAVAITQTINLPFGSGLTVPGTGIILNNEMDDFAKAQGVPNAFGLVDTTGANAIAAGKRPLSSMTPSILLKDGKLFMLTGSPGGPRIISTTLLSILNVVDYGMNAQQAVAASRFHHQWLPDKLFLEPDVPEDVIRALKKRGHHIEVSQRWWSSAQVILFDHDRGLFFGGSDPRSDGAAMGPGSVSP